MSVCGQRCCCHLHPPLLFICCSVTADVAPPLPVKQRRAQSVMSERSSVSRLYSHDDAVSPRHTISHSPAELTAALDNVLTELNHHGVVNAAVPEKPPLNTLLMHSAADTAPPKPPLNRVLAQHNHATVNNVLTELSHAADAAPKKPPLNMRISSYDNLASSEDTVDGSSAARMSSDGTSKNFMSNHTDSNDATSGYLVSSSHEMSQYRRTSHLCNEATLSSASCVSTSRSNADAPPLPVKKHSMLWCLFMFSVL